MENSKTFGVSSDSEHVYTELRTVVPDQFYTYRVFIKKKHFILFGHESGHKIICNNQELILKPEDKWSCKRSPDISSK